ncbi:MAG TPA: Holliday junction resolvase RuvX, partial [Candidatus Angelobacter sp.]|nr:Holliday junction resolvase RuvX [Candidatus Angelobacter sp.]
MESGRILAIDYGSRRMGLAVSDLLGITAQGLETLERKNKRADFGRLERTIREYQVREIVLGNPLRMSGE